MSETIKTQLFINGAAVDASDVGFYDIHNPARPSELVGRAAAASPDDVETAMQAAHAAFPAWAAFSYTERGDMLRRVAAAITQDMDEVKRRAAIFTREHEKFSLKPGLKFRATDTVLTRPQTMVTGLPKTKPSRPPPTTRSSHANPALDVVRREQFGPILPIMAFDDEADDIAIAHDDQFGLASSIWTQDRTRAIAMSRQIEVG